MAVPSSNRLFIFTKSTSAQKTNFPFELTPFLGNRLTEKATLIRRTVNNVEKHYFLHEGASTKHSIILVQRSASQSFLVLKVIAFQFKLERRCAHSLVSL